VLLLAGYFLEENRARMGLRSLRLTSEAQKRLVGYRWPGNVRELEHLISRGVLKALSMHTERPRILTIEAHMLGLEDLTLAVAPAVVEAVPVEASSVTVSTGPTLKASVDSYQKTLIEQALLKHQGKWIEVAREMGLDRANLSRLAKRLGIR
jgi:anaerobic nitric oxide reductase transcription regulator